MLFDLFYVGDGVPDILLVSLLPLPGRTPKPTKEVRNSGNLA